MAEDRTVGELFKAKSITNEDVSAAVDAYMAGLKADQFVIGDHALDLREAVKANRWASDVVADHTASDHLKRAAIRTAILLARPEKR